MHVSQHIPLALSPFIVSYNLLICLHSLTKSGQVIKCSLFVYFLESEEDESPLTVWLVPVHIAYLLIPAYISTL